MVKKNIYLFTVICLLINLASAQENLVPNPSFEDTFKCPVTDGSINTRLLEGCSEWYRPNTATTDYYNECSDAINGVSVPNNFTGIQIPYEGNAYVGLSSLVIGSEYAAEYVQVKMFEPLKSNRIYRIGFQISLADYSDLIIKDMGLRIDKVPIDKQANSSFQFYGFALPCHICADNFINNSEEWTKIEGNFKAKGDEEFLTIGRFYDTTAFTFQNLPNEKNDCSPCFSQTQSHPPHAYYYIDDVFVYELPCQVAVEAANVFTPNDDGVNDLWIPFEFCDDEWSGQIFNRWGQIVGQLDQTDRAWAGYDLNGNKLPEGVYFYQITYSGELFSGNFHLVRNQ